MLYEAHYETDVCEKMRTYSLSSPLVGVPSMYSIVSPCTRVWRVTYDILM